MANPNTIKNSTSEQKLFRQRAAAAGVFVLALVSVLLGWMAYLQIFNHDHFITLSIDNRVRVVPLPPPRGLIYDRNGVLLAENRPSYHLEVVPAQVEDLDETLARLVNLVPLNEDDLRRFKLERRRKQPFQSIVLRSNLSDSEVARFAVNRHTFPGVDITARLERHYPLGALGVHALGYVGRIDERELQALEPQNYEGTVYVGKLGIEKYYETILHGTIGHQQVEINAQGRTLRVLSSQPPVPGTSLILTLDTGLQKAVEEALGNHKGAVVAMDPRNGEVLALASMPSFDPNLFVEGVSASTYQRLLHHLRRPLFNRALSGQYSPGSTIKPLVALAGLNYAVTLPGRTMMTYGYYQLPNGHRRYRDWKHAGHGMVNMAKALTQSCDVYFYDLAYRLGIDRLHDFLARFGLGNRIGLDSTGEAGGLLPSSAWKRQTYGQPWYPGETVITGIGQGYLLTTPLQLATATSTLAMRGKRVKPRLLRATMSAAGSRLEPQKSAPLAPITLKQTAFWDRVIDAMIAVVHQPNGTAHKIGKDAQYLIAGKTGTAQVFSLRQNESYDEQSLDTKLRDHSLFIGFAPANDPRIAIAVVVENAGSGAKVAAPVARKVMDAYLLGATTDPAS